MTINLTNAAVILWLGMMIIAGALLVLSSQVRHLVELLENRTEAPTAPVRRVRTSAVVPSPGRARNTGPRAPITALRSPGRGATVRELV